MFEEEKLNRLESLADHFAEREVRAAARLAEISGKNWYFAILGLKTEIKLFEFASIAKLQRVIEPPGEVELASALRDKSIFSAVGRYSHFIQFELSVNRNFGSTEQAAFNLAWWIISALRVRTLSEILIPAVSDYSWSTIAAVSDGDCYIQLLEDVPRARRLTEPTQVNSDDLEWVLSNLLKFSEMLEVPKFRLAVESLTSYHFQSSERIVVAALWAGIEALFELQSELRFRLAILIASILEPRGVSRGELFRKVKKLYDFRSKAVHGSQLTNDKINEHIIEVRTLLSQLLCKFTEVGKVPNEQELDDFLFC